jgi:hypothetical protein
MLRKGFLRHKTPENIIRKDVEFSTPFPLFSIGLIYSWRVAPQQSSFTLQSNKAKISNLNYIYNLLKLVTTYQYSLETKSPYILKSLIFQIFDVLIWLKDFIDKHPSKQDNLNQIPPYLDNALIGIVYNKHFKGHAYFRPQYGNQTAFIKKDFVDQFKLENNSIIKVEVYQNVKNIL